MIIHRLILLLIVLISASSVAEARVYLDIVGQSYKKITIAAPPFKSEGDEKLKSSMTEVLGKDLDFSGFFVVAPTSLIDRELAEEGVEKRAIRFENWKSLGIELVCKGLLQEKDNNLMLEAYLYDVSDGSLLFAKRYRARTEEWKRVVHRLADDIILAVTGEKGIMSSKVLLVSGDRRQKDVYVSDLDGGGLRRVTNYGNILVSPAVSPTGRYLAFTSYREGRPNLYVIDLDKNREVYSNKEEGLKVGATWVDARRLAYSHTAGRQSTIYMVNIETKERTVVLRKDGILTSPSFSGDCSKMAFVSDMYGGPQVFSMDLASGEIKRLTYSGNYNTSPAFSPKGDFVAYVAKTGGAIEICIMRADGSDPRILTDGGLNDSPQFSPCGRYIIYSSLQGKRTSIRLMLFNGENKRSLTFTNNEEAQPKFMP